MTLSDPGVKRAIEDGWVSAWHNQCPGLYCNNTADSRKPIPYPPEQLATVHEGAGGGNIRLFFCDSEGRIIHYVAGFVAVDRFLDEVGFANQLLAAPSAAASLRTNRRLLNLESTSIGRNVLEVLREIEDAVYTKGAIG